MVSLITFTLYICYQHSRVAYTHSVAMVFAFYKGAITGAFILQRHKSGRVGITIFFPSFFHMIPLLLRAAQHFAMATCGFYFY